MAEDLPMIGSSTTWQVAFIASLRAEGNVRAACERANVSRQAAYRARQTNAGFRKQWASALEDAVDALAEEAHRRAISHSDTLLIYLLKIHGGEYWRQDQRSRIDVGGVREAVERLGRAEGLTDAEIEAAVAEAERLLDGREGRRDSHQKG